MRRAKNIARRPAVRSPASRIVVATEGVLTEPAYLKVFNQLYGNHSLRLTPIRVGGDPRAVVERVIEEKERVEGDSLAKRDTFWAVFDRDIHSRFEEAKDLALGNGIHLAISNPCFELWGVLHYQEQNAPIDRHKCQRLLEKLCGDYDPNKGKIFNDRTVIEQAYLKAVERSADSTHRRIEEGDPDGNPSTTVHNLTEYIRCFKANE